MKIRIKVLKPERSDTQINMVDLVTVYKSCGQ